jgi:hypothetical protein
LSFMVSIHDSLSRAGSPIRAGEEPVRWHH